MGESFKPDPNMIRLYHIYTSLVTVPLAIIGLLVTWIISWFNLAIAYSVALIFFTPLIVVSAFVLYWIGRYYESITYHLTDDEVMVERGVWWKMKHTVPYSRVMSLDIVQGPISRRLGMATVDVYTAGYTGVAGGSGGPRTRRAEASILCVSNFAEVREEILGMVRGRPLFGARPGDVGAEIIAELRKIRSVLER